MKHFLIVTVLFISFPMICLRADDKPLASPRPTKDPVASKKHLHGSGLFFVGIDKPSGKVKLVQICRSTGNVFLDVDVINTLLQWRFKPNVESVIRIPITFTPDNDVASFPVGGTWGSRPCVNISFSEPVTPSRLHQLFPTLY